MDKEYLTVKEFAELYQIKPNTVRAYIRTKKLKAKFACNKYYIHISEFKTLLKDVD